MKQYLFEILPINLETAGFASSKIRKILSAEGIDKALIRRVAIASYEAEINVVIHSYGGMCRLEYDDKIIKLEFHDRGPGIRSIDDAMKEGWSTASKRARENGFGAGMGFPNMKRVSDVLDIKTSEKGTIVTIIFYIGGNDESKESI